ncbi:MAG: enoyl-CoA hydratase [Frankia sp.]
MAIALDRVGAVGRITIDRHERRNALDTEHCDALRAAVAEALAGGARSLLVTGAGSSFCSGADLTAVYAESFRVAQYGLISALADAPVPVIAAVNGPAMGAGAQLAIACDLRVAAPTAQFSIPTARTGLAVDPWTVERLATLAGGGPARALLLGGDSLSAERAHACGLADRLGSVADALDWAEEIATLAPLSLAYSKKALDRVGHSQRDQPEVTAAFDACWISEDMREARQARAEKRRPVFQGR